MRQIMMKQWDVMINQLKCYRAEFGNCNVPYEWAKNPRLAHWVNELRQKYRAGRLNDTQIDELNALDFSWYPLEDQWDTNFKKLKAYKLKYGDTNVPVAWKSDPVLANWVRTVRMDYKNGKLSSDKIAKLNALGFSWDPRKDKWDDMIKKLKAYKAEFGNCNVPQKWAKDIRLANWVSRLRREYRAGRLDDIQISELNALDFSWHLLGHRWDTNFKKLKAYKLKYGDTNVPVAWKSDPALANWIGVQRRLHLSGKLSKARYEALNQIGFKWSSRQEYKWDEMYKALKQYKQEHGDCNVPKKKPYLKLARWIEYVYVKYRNGNLPKAKISQLNKLGFIW